ncbi:MAG: hypothetical protein K2N39_02075 [Lachnospiraceae bacterium]|nr:hypothetical protein [Lachnospiraceae bacterium]
MKVKTWKDKMPTYYPEIFLITSICGAAFDLLFVMMQRYNRTRL